MSDPRPVIYSVRGPKTIDEMTGHEFVELAARTDICLLAGGSVEQHGPHAPLGMDTILGVDIARRTAGRLAELGLPVFVAPPLPFGTTPYLADQPGTISISSTTLRRLIKEVCRGLLGHGIRRFVFILGHSGNQATMQVAGEELVHEADAEVLYLNPILPVMERVRREGLLRETTHGAHGGESETSRVMATYPELVDLSKAVRWSFPESRTPPREHGSPPYMGGAAEYMMKSYRDIMPHGSAGDPALSTAEQGERLYGIAVDWCSQLVLDHYQAPRPAVPQQDRQA